MTIRVTYIESNGTKHHVLARVGASAMESARDNGVPGIDAFCGGQASCGTCHVFVDLEWLDLTGRADPEIELSLLEPMGGTKGNSRLACQIRLTDKLDGLVVRLPERQG
jgi:2Fe-2S ferredoxin